MTLPATLEKLASLPKHDIVAFLSNIQKNFLALNQKTEVLEVPINHYFSQDVYAREMVVPKGSVVLGKIHKFCNLNILSKGEVSIISIDGVMRIKAPHTFVASPGSQRLFYMHEDTVWTVIHGTNMDDLEKIENHFIAKSYDELEGNPECLGLLQSVQA